MRIATLQTSSPAAPRRRSRATACLQVTGLLIALTGCVAFVAPGAVGASTGEPATAERSLSHGDTNERPRLVELTLLSAALVPEPGAWMMTTLGLLGLEWMARRKRVA